VNQTVRKYYDEIAEREWERLSEDAYHRLEFIVTTHYLDKYLPKKGGLILDAGGGPGRYTIYLAKKGFDVILLDLSPRCLEIAKREIKSIDAKDHVKKIVEGSVADLHRFEDDLFDAVLCLGGPLSHLLSQLEREKAAKEIVRVAKKSAPIFVSVFSRYGVFRAFLQLTPDEITDPSHEELFNYGIHRGHSTPHKGGRGFSKVDAYFFLPNEVKTLFESFGVETLEMVSCEGLSSRLQEATNRLYQDKEKWNRWLKLVLETCDDPTILGMGDHILYVGRKTGL
jgi:ubiquinone/menaquinone biosynthesis C-methylase UbiE